MLNAQSLLPVLPILMHVEFVGTNVQHDNREPLKHLNVLNVLLLNLVLVAATSLL